MNRRKFIKLSALGLTSLSFGRMLSACGGPGNAAVAKTVSEWLSEFARTVGATVLSDGVMKWMNGLGDSEKARVADVHQMMKDNQFDVFNTQVFGYGNTIFYGVGNRDGFNACSPFHLGYGANDPLIEGPALMGMCFAGTGWNNSDVYAVDALIPIKQHQNTGSQFETSLSTPLHYDTRAGTLDIGYAADPASRKGLVSVVAKRSNGGLLLGQDYDIQWS